MSGEEIEIIWSKFMSLDSEERKRVFPMLFGSFEYIKENKEFFYNADKIIDKINEK